MSGGRPRSNWHRCAACRCIPLVSASALTGLISKNSPRAPTPATTNPRRRTNSRRFTPNSPTCCAHNISLPSPPIYRLTAQSTRRHCKRKPLTARPTPRLQRCVRPFRCRWSHFPNCRKTQSARILRLRLKHAATTASASRTLRLPGTTRHCSSTSVNRPKPRNCRSH